jgi:elongation factor 1-gamma
MGVTNKSREYLSRFPLGKIPALFTASGFNLTESSAIAYYVADCGPKREQLLGSTAEERALVQQWTFFTETSLMPAAVALILPLVGAKPFDEKVCAEKDAELKRWLEYVEGHLKATTWLVRNDVGPSLADLFVAATVDLAFKYYVDKEMREGYPSIVAWFDRVMCVPEVKEIFGKIEWVEKRGAPGTVSYQ